ncbi:phosphate ABC transporter substrate-binding protein [Clostridium sp. ATCC 25772]|uniref:phosphate ABC transporter substrate-binding protein n=1 Tax=Clostridium sp. ATCC 25772 TaxID=1676991 RepID=UPI0007847F92|nr:phosphate ABC transporter substrate-binding protein [Clostridium sp. ATCC 25772]
MKKKLIAIVSSTLIISTMLIGCSSKSKVNESDSTSIKISGSTSVAPLMEKESAEYKGKNPNTNIEIQAVGSSAGIQNTINGVTELGMSSRDLKEEEKAAGLKEEVVAYDGIAVITNKNNTVKNLTMIQIKDIYTGKITNWKELGGKDAPIVVVSREDGSGTRDAFQEILKFSSEELIQDATIGDGSGNIKTTVEKNENAIGYISFEYIDDSITVQKIDGIEATVDNVKSNAYKLSRSFLLIYREDKISEESKEFLDFILSEEGQNIVENSGSIKLK